MKEGKPMQTNQKNIFRIIMLLVVVSLALALLLSVLNTTINAMAMSPDYYTIYTESNEELCTRGEEVEVGDSYISYDNKRYEIIEVDEETKNCKARYIEDVKMPTMQFGDLVNVMVEIEKRAGLYISHNDESYIPNEGTESIYGAGGIHDVARAFKTALQNEGFFVDLDETLHLPHDNSAYRRSRATAQKIINEFNPDVLFDVHRDGAPRRIYDTVVGGEPMSAVRMVVGQGNPNFEENYQFALEIKSLADRWYPGLVKDIYLGARSYNQDLLPTALLLEFGSEEVEKELVLKSLPLFANVINGVLQQRAVQGTYYNEAITMVNAQNNTDRVIFYLMVLVGSFILLFLFVYGISKKIRTKVNNNCNEVKKGLFISRKR